MTEHEFEPIPGLPEPLPEGERLLWQGAPRWDLLARGAFHIGKLALYFGLLAAVSAVAALMESGSLLEAAMAAIKVVPFALVAIGLLTLIAWLIARTTIYTLTERRLVMRIGVALPIILNIPYRLIENAALKRNEDGSGDIAVTIGNHDRIAYLHLWPHAQPWHLAHPRPMLRGLPEAQPVAAILSAALLAAAGESERNPQAAAPLPAAEIRPLATAA
jgi:hypothetical protein